MKNKNTLLWKVTSKSHAQASYLFGTMHVKDLRAFHQRDLVHQKIDACEAFATEFNLDEMKMNTSEQVMDLPEGMFLSDLIPAKAYKKVEQLFASLTGMELKLFDRSLPLLISNMLSECVLSSDMPHSLDESLWEYARSQEKILLGIESFEEQIEILRKIPLDYQVKSLIWTAKNTHRFQKQLLKMTRLYETADLRKLYKAARKNAKGLRKVLLFDRNELMAERFALIAQEQSICYAVGAGHLGGKKGLLRLLKNKGFKIKPVLS